MRRVVLVCAPPQTTMALSPRILLLATLVAIVACAAAADAGAIAELPPATPPIANNWYRPFAKWLPVTCSRAPSATAPARKLLTRKGKGSGGAHPPGYVHPPRAEGSKGAHPPPTHHPTPRLRAPSPCRGRQGHRPRWRR